MSELSSNVSIVGIGSNTEGAVLHVLEALWTFKNTEGVTDVVASRHYTTPSYNGCGEDYTNMVAQVTTSLSLDDFVALTKNMEVRAGRTPEMKGTGVVPLDVDVVVWNGNVVRPSDFERRHFTIGYAALNPA